MPVENILSHYLKASKLSQQVVADKIGVSQTTIHKWLSGKNKPSGEHLKKIYEICHIPAETKLPESEETENNLLKKLLAAKDEQIALMKEMLRDLKAKFED